MPMMTTAMSKLLAAICLVDAWRPSRRRPCARSRIADALRDDRDIGVLGIEALQRLGEIGGQRVAEHREPRRADRSSRSSAWRGGRCGLARLRTTGFSTTSVHRLLLLVIPPNSRSISVLRLRGAAAVPAPRGCVRRRLRECSCGVADSAPAPARTSAACRSAPAPPRQGRRSRCSERVALLLHGRHLLHGRSEN